MKKLNKQAGFTLAELLIVVAIIAILVAIGVPAFSTAMERSRETVDLANIRGAYAEFMAGTLGGSATDGYYKLNIKQRDVTSDWIVDCSGFLSNIDSTIKKMPTASLVTGDCWVHFAVSGTGEKPTVEFKGATKPTPSNVIKNGDDWILSSGA